MNGKVIWITGLSGAGKTTLAKELTLRLRQMNLEPIFLDGDILRNIFKMDELGTHCYSRDSRISLALKYGLLCKTLSSQGFTVVISTISMFNEIYAWNRENLTNYLEVYLKVPLDELYLRDPKKIYQRYKNGSLNNVAGLDLQVDEPTSSDVTYDFNYHAILWDNPTNLVDSLLQELKRKLFSGSEHGCK